MARKQVMVGNEVEALVAEQAVLLARELRRTCDSAADGAVLDAAEGVILGQGRELLRLALEASLQQQAGEVEKKGQRRGAAVADSSVGRKAGGSEPC